MAQMHINEVYHFEVVLPVQSISYDIIMSKNLEIQHFVGTYYDDT